MQTKQTRERPGIKRLIGAALMAAILTLALTACSAKGNGAAENGKNIPAGNTGSPSADEQQKDTRKIEKGESLTIPLSEISETARFYPITVDGTAMEIIAVKAPDGTLRTAFNTCQVCYDSGRGYYKQSGDKLVCQNCGNQFPMSSVEIEAGGCNPWPIFAENKTVTDQSITISYDFLNESKDIFSNWKVN